MGPGGPHHPGGGPMVPGQHHPMGPVSSMMGGPHMGGPPMGGVLGRNPRNRSLKGRKMQLASFPNQGHLLMDENAEYAQNSDRDTYLLGTPLDGESLSDRQCYVRSHFVELFISSSADVSARHSRGAQKLHINQIGLRCAYCVKLKARDRAERAICYPSSISRIYQTVADMQRFHFESCVAIPPKVLHTYKSLKTTRPRGVGSPQSYWDKSAREIGLIDTEDGIQVNVQEGGETRLGRQKKSVATGMLEPLEQGQPPAHQQQQQVHSSQEQMQQHHDNTMQQGPQAQFVQGHHVQVKNEQVQLGTSSLHHGHHNPTMAQAPAPAVAGSTPLAAVVSSPGSENASKDEDEQNKGVCSSTPGCVPPGPGMLSNASKQVDMAMATSMNVEAEEDANILLMLKKTPESPPRDVPVKEEQQRQQIVGEKTTDI